ncbi:winged helix-turn-helix domain-containing protein [Halococcus salsus]|uniref:winged helix-turn-helix domain-containing protein n=1 Tax=Halococcus salsus TaxID=2162894 RepID=UPI00135CA92F|nr:winged helix-turn-helix domain-containing protein [Halococcus salsus]
MDERDEQGQFTKKYSTEEILAAVHEYEPASTTEIANAVGFARQNADYRLRQLQEEGKVRSKKVGPSLVWMATDE